MRGFFGVALYYPKWKENLGSFMRLAQLYNASFISLIGSRYKHQYTNTMKTERHVPIYEYSTYEEFKASIPIKTDVVAIELDDNSELLPSFVHPNSAIYLFGAEDKGIPQEVLNHCSYIVEIPTALPYSMNVATAGGIVLYDRYAKRNYKG